MEKVWKVIVWRSRLGTSVWVKMTSGAVTLFFLAAALKMASASSTRPWERSNRGDSGMNLHQAAFMSLILKPLLCILYTVIILIY